MSSKSNQDPNDHHEPHPWLEEKVYAKLRQRSVDLVKQSIDALRKDKQRVSLATIAAKSKELDPERRGISESAILDNQEARNYYDVNACVILRRNNFDPPCSLPFPPHS